MGQFATPCIARPMESIRANFGGIARKLSSEKNGQAIAAARTTITEKFRTISDNKFI